MWLCNAVPFNNSCNKSRKEYDSIFEKVFKPTKYAEVLKKYSNNHAKIGTDMYL